MKNPNHLSKVFQERKYFIEFLVVIVGLGIGLEIFANGIIEYYEINPFYSILLGALITAIVVMFIAKGLLAYRVLKKDIEGIIFYREKDSRTIDTYPYSFGSAIYDYFDCLFNENSAIKRKWEKENISFNNGILQKRKDDHYGYNLVVNAVQYFLINKISVHLSDYFVNKNLDEEKLLNLTRENIPEILFKNEFLELFSKPMSLRPKFFNDEDDESVDGAYEDGLLYEKFELSLPKKSTIKVVRERLIITTPRFELKIKTVFDGDGGYDIYSEVLQHYFGIKKAKKILSYKIRFEISVKFKTLPLFTKWGWLYYNWIDSLLHWLDEEISFDSFLESINWNTVSTIIHVNKIKKKRKLH